jgi:transposase
MLEQVLAVYNAKAAAESKDEGANDGGDALRYPEVVVAEPEAFMAYFDIAAVRQKCEELLGFKLKRRDKITKKAHGTISF